MVKRHIALVLAGAAASVAGGLRLVQELVERGDGHAPENGGPPTDRQTTTPPPAPSSADSSPPAPSSNAPAAESPSPEATPAEPAADETSATPAGAAPTGAPAGASKAELYEIATTLDISGRSKMNKSQLIEAINAAS